MQQTHRWLANAENAQGDWEMQTDAHDVWEMQTDAHDDWRLQRNMATGECGESCMANAAQKTSVDCREGRESW